MFIFKVLFIPMIELSCRPWYTWNYDFWYLLFLKTQFDILSFIDICLSSGANGAVRPGIGDSSKAELHVSINYSEFQTTYGGLMCKWILFWFQLNRKIRWLAALFCACIAIFSYYPMDLHYKYNAFDGAMVSFINSYCWLIFFIWIVWYCEMIGKCKYLQV